MTWLLLACANPEPAATRPPPDLAAHCRDAIGEPRVEEVAPDVFVALGYDLANTILIRRPDGNVVIDVGMSPSRAAPVRDALLAASPGPVLAVIYTHSHIDHVGGATVWVEDGTEVWATDAFGEHFLKQYGDFLGAERARGRRQFGQDIPQEQLPCSALGARPDIGAALEMGVVLPTHTFSGETEVHGVRLVEAHGETHDQLFAVYEAALMPGDNWYRAFPNLYTIRGSTPRPVDDWIDSLDAMRALQPELLIPSHTAPVTEDVEGRLRDYRDGIQFVRDAVVRGANAGVSVDDLAELELPPHLAARPELAELYGQIDWSVRAIYANELGWFDGRTEALYPLPPDELRARTVEAMGGEAAVLEAARHSGDPRWALHLYALVDGPAEEVAVRYEELAQTVPNSNGRAWLLQSATELRGQDSELGSPMLRADFIEALPVESVFSGMTVRLKSDEALEVQESLRFELVESTWTLTVRRGVAELAEGSPLPGTPDPVATLRCSENTWKRIALQQESPAAALASGELEIDGSLPALVGFLARFERGF